MSDEGVTVDVEQPFPDRGAARKLFWKVVVLAVFISLTSLVMSLSIYMLVITTFVREGFGFDSSGDMGLFDNYGLVLGTWGLFFIATPMLGGVLAEKLGYRRVLMLSFAGQLVGIPIAIVTAILAGAGINWMGLFIPMAVMGGSAGLATPVFYASIAKAYGPDRRNFIFIAYFFAVSALTMGASISILPLFTLLGLFSVVLNAGYVLIPIYLVLGLFIAVAVLLSWKLYTEPPPMASESGPVDMGADAVNTLSDRNFIFLIIIIVGYFLIASIHSEVVDYRFKEAFLSNWDVERFMLMTSLVSYASIAASVIAPLIFMFALRKQPPFRWLVVGVALATAGFFVSGIIASLPTLVLGMLLFRTGEVLVKALFLVLVANGAPRSKMGAYMGFSFAPVVAAFLGGLVLSGLLGMAYRFGAVALFTALVASIGAATVILLIFYYRLFVKAEEAPRPPGGDPAMQPPQKPVRKGFGLFITPGSTDRLLTHRAGLVVCAAFIPLMLISGGVSFALSDPPALNPSEKYSNDGPWFGEFNYEEMDMEDGPGDLLQGYLEEQTTMEFDFEVDISANQYLACLDITLVWEDEPDIRRVLRTYNNEPDTFSVCAIWRSGTLEGEFDPIEAYSPSVSNVEEQPGEILLGVCIDHYDMSSTRGEGTWSIQVTLEEAGDFRAQGPSLTYYADDGNDFSLIVETTLYVEE